MCCNLIQFFISHLGKGITSQKLQSLNVPGPKLIPASKPHLEASSHESRAPQLCGTTVPYTPQQFQAPHAFAPQDLLALLKNLEAEISVCQASLRDENEKRKKYKVRTDSFFFDFIILGCSCFIVSSSLHLFSIG